MNDSKSTTVEELGRSGRAVLRDLREQVVFLGRAAASLASAVIAPRLLRWPAVKRVLETSGVNALPVVSAISFLMGLIIAAETAHRLATFGAEILVSGIVGFTAVRDISPLLTAVLLSGRSGSAFAAELGAMKIGDELDALVTMRLDPIRFLVVHRIIASVILTPVLTVYSMAMVIAGGTVVMLALGYTVEGIFHEMAARVYMSDIGLGVGKSMLFGFIIAGVGCLRGLQTGPGAISLGISTTRTIVTSIVLIILADTVFATASLLQRL